MQQPTRENFREWVRLIQSEFAEMPGLHLSKRQAQRLWNLDAPSADAIFCALEASHFLKRMPDSDVYIRAGLGC
jgi:putative heme degradation protein